MKRTLVAGVAAGVVAVGGGVIAANLSSPSLPDVQVPAIELSSAEGVDATVAWLDLFTQTSGGSADSLDTNFAYPGVDAVPGETPLVVIDPQNSAAEFDKILDGIVDNAGSQLNAVTSPGNGPDAVTYLFLNNGS